MRPSKVRFLPIIPSSVFDLPTLLFKSPAKSIYSLLFSVISESGFQNLVLFLLISSLLGPYTIAIAMFAFLSILIFNFSNLSVMFHHFYKYFRCYPFGSHFLFSPLHIIRCPSRSMLPVFKLNVLCPSFLSLTFFCRHYLYRYYLLFV